MKKKKKIFVTGGNGFIGTNLCDYLVRNGYDVISYDIAEKKIQNNVEWIRGNILDYKMMCESMKSADVVIHLAAMVGVKNCLQNPKQVIHVNIKGTDNVINACSYNRINNIIFASSSEVYGEGYENSILCEQSPTNPKSLYGKSKLYAEQRLVKYSKHFNAKVSVLRYCNVYGPYQRTDFVISLFVSQVKNNIPLTVCGDGYQKRCYTYVDDAIELTARAIERTHGNEYEILNVSYSYESTIFDIINVLEKVSNKKLSICRKEYDELGRKSSYEVINRIVSSYKAQKILQFEPQIDLYKGIQKLYEFNAKKY